MIGRCVKSPDGKHVEVILRIGEGRLSQEYGICKFCQEKGQSYKPFSTTVWDNATKIGRTTEDKHRVSMIWNKGRKPITRADF